MPHPTDSLDPTITFDKQRQKAEGLTEKLEKKYFEILS